MFDFSNLISFFHPVLLVKIVTLIIIGSYIIFAFVIFTQVKAMGQILSLPNASIILKTIILINVAAAIMLFLLAVVIL